MRANVGSLKVNMIWDDTIAAWKVRFPFDRNFLDEMKKLIPHGARKWNNDEKVWIVDDQFSEEIRELSEKYFDGFVEHKPTPPPIINQVVEATCYKTFVEMVPLETLKKAYREVIITLHSDKGGDDKKAALFNEAWGMIKKELGVK